MISNNPFYQLAETLPPIFMKIFFIALIALVVFGTLLDIIYKKIDEKLNEK